MEDMAERIQLARKYRGLSQQELASRAGLSIGAIHQIEQRRRTDPQISTLYKIADGLGVDVMGIIRDPRKTRRR